MYEHKYRSPHDASWFTDAARCPASGQAGFGKLVSARDFTRFGSYFYWLLKVILDFQLVIGFELLFT